MGQGLGGGILEGGKDDVPAQESRLFPPFSSGLLDHGEFRRSKGEIDSAGALSLGRGQVFEGDA